MEQFKNRLEGFKEIRKAILMRALPMSLLAGLGGLAISYFNSSNHQNDLAVFPFVILMMLGALSYGTYRGIKRQQSIFESYVFTIDESGITRIQHNTPAINIPNEEIKEIVKNSDGSFTIYGNSVLNNIGVPAQIEFCEQVEKLLSDKKSITIKAIAPWYQKSIWLLPIATIGLMAGVYISNDKIIVGISGTVLLMTLGFSFFTMQKSKNIDNKTRKSSWWVILVTVSVIVILYYKLTAR